jgi:hypothetical protein
VDGPGEGVTESAPLGSQGGWEAFRERQKVMWRDRPFRSMRRVASTVRTMDALRAPSAQGDGPSTIDLTHDAEYGAPRLLV